MIESLFVKLDNRIVPISEIIDIDISEVHTETVIVSLMDGSTSIVTGFFAVELVWLLKPSALEGNNKIKWKKNVWAVHNLIAHPFMQIFAWCKWYKLAIWLHEITVPKPIGVKR